MYFLSYAFDAVLDQKSSYEFVLAARFVFSIKERPTKYVAEHTHAYITRNISHPVWLWPARRAEVFDPGWSVILFIGLLIEQTLFISVVGVHALTNR